jgi:hypothetical protein
MVNGDTDEDTEGGDDDDGAALPTTPSPATPAPTTPRPPNPPLPTICERRSAPAIITGPAGSNSADLTTDRHTSHGGDGGAPVFDGDFGPDGTVADDGFETRFSTSSASAHSALWRSCQLVDLSPEPIAAPTSADTASQCSPSRD